MLATTPMSALELCDAIRNGKAFDASRLSRIDRARYCNVDFSPSCRIEI